ncbi:MAG TPA: hypothetical protein VHQ01_06845 [Pyrinomonadaceae bacterium]|nr:hypothetical protein [Pyrinomonadaceae bacterium]
MTNNDFYPGAINAGDCVSNAWNLVKNNYGMYLGIALIGMILSGCIPCVSLFLVGPILGGIYYVVLREMNGEPVEFGMMFKGFEKFVPLMVIGLIQAIPEIIGQILRVVVQFGQIGLNGGRDRDFDFYAPKAPELLAGGLLIVVAIVALVLILFGVIWRVLLFFAIPIALERDLSPVDAMKLSAKAAMSNLGGLIVLFIFEFLIALLGIIALCIGIFFVIPIIYAANAFAYRQVFPLIRQNFNMAPPPPNAYGDFGQGM